jgi:hypothetical protein
MMSIVLLLVAGLLNGAIETEDCIEALHQLRTVERLDIVATDVLEDNVIAYTLSDGPRTAAKTAILVCQREVDAVDDADGAEDDLASEIIEPAGGSGEETDEPLAE